MISPLKIFLWTFVFLTSLGLLVGTLNLMNPAAVHIPFGPNGESAEGIDGVLASTLSSGVLGIIFGSLFAAAAWLVRLGVGDNKTNSGDKTK